MPVPDTAYIYEKLKQMVHYHCVHTCIQQMDTAIHININLKSSFRQQCTTTNLAIVDSVQVHNYVHAGVLYSKVLPQIGDSCNILTY